MGTEMAQIDTSLICYGCVGILEKPGMKCPHCGWDNSIREEQWGRLPSTTLKNGRFFVGHPLGAGGFGVTYLGRDLYAGEYEDARRAIKEFFPMGMAIRKADGVSVSPSASEMVQTFEKRRSRSQREGKRMADISASVSNVVRAYDCFDENGTTYIVMEYIDGDTLSTIVKKKGPFPWREAYARLKPVLTALKKMHDMQFYHMDISPDNIMLRRRRDGSYGEPVILDFGASIEGGASDVTRSRSAITVRDGYTPPEQYTANLSEMSGRDDETCRMDEYAICATLYFAITGKVPTSSTARLTGAKIQPLSSFDKSIPEYFEAAISKGMSLKVSDRFNSMENLITALESPPARGKKVLAITLVICLLAAAGTLGLYILNRQYVPLDADGRLTWNRSGKALSAELVGTRGDSELRYALEDGVPVTLTGSLLDRYDWKLEEFLEDKTSKAYRIRSKKASGVNG